MGYRCLETEGIRSNTHRYFFWITFHSYSVHFVSNEVTLKLENKIHCHEKLIPYTLGSVETATGLFYFIFEHLIEMIVCVKSYSSSAFT